MELKEELRLGFVYTIEVIRRGILVASETVHNIIPTEGRNHVLSIIFNGGVQVPTWYGGLFENNYTPVAGDTMVAFPAVAAEVTTYVEATRATWNEAAPVAGVITNSASPAVFTMNNGTQKTLFGAFLSSNSVKGGTTGVLVSAAKFAASKAVDTGDIVRLTASITLTSS